MTPAEARIYITTFCKHTMPGAAYADFPSGRIYFNNMTDDQAVKVAHGLMDIEAEAAKGAPKQ